MALTGHDGEWERSTWKKAGCTMKPGRGQNRYGINHGGCDAEAGPNGNDEIHWRIRLVEGGFGQIGSGHDGGEDRRSQQHRHRNPAQDLHFHSP